MRARIALAVSAAALSAPVAASAAVTSNPNALGATMQYLEAATASCYAGQPPGQLPAPGGSCTGITPFTVVMRVVARDRYRIEVTNTRTTGNFRYFAWILADGMTLRRIVSTRGGSCGPSSGMISCTRRLAAGGCGCAQRDLIVDFTAGGREPTRAKGGYWIHYGLVTPYLDTPTTFNDLPICTPGEKSTSAHPCLK
jgi:hypothetical protein